MSTYAIGLSSWIIRDRNQPDVRIGDEAEFAIRFEPRALEPTAEPGRMVQSLGQGLYRVRAQVIYANARCWVIDFGLLAYHTAKPPARKNDWVEGEVALSVDPCFDNDELRGTAAIPELRRRFRIRDVLLETTPWAPSVDRHGVTVLMRDSRNRSFAPIAETDAWHDEANAHYVLECEMIDGPGDRLPAAPGLLNLKDED